MDAAGTPAIDFAIRGPITSADLPGLCERVCALLAGAVLTGDAGSELRCDVDGVPADAGTVEALARLQLAAGRHRCRVRLRNASRELLELVEFMGLTDVLPGG